MTTSTSPWPELRQRRAADARKRGRFLQELDRHLRAVGAGIYGMSTGDFNHDAQLDLVTVKSRRRHRERPDPADQRPLPPAASYPVGSQPRAVKTGDFNNDGWLDLVWPVSMAR